MKTQRFPFTMSFWTNPQNNVVELHAGEHFRFDLDALSIFCLEVLPARLVDFLRIASSVDVVDRLVKRHTRGGARKASRTIGLKVEVLDAGFWKRGEVRDTIHEVVDFVSGDFWEIEFVSDTQDSAWPQRFLPFPKTS